MGNEILIDDKIVPLIFLLLFLPIKNEIYLVNPIFKPSIDILTKNKVIVNPKLNNPRRWGNHAGGSAGGTGGRTRLENQSGRGLRPGGRSRDPTV